MPKQAAIEETSPAQANAYARRRQRTRDALLDAAIDVFVHRGFEGATAEEIASRAQVSRASFYLHFPSKSEVLIACLDRRLDVRKMFSAQFRDQATRGGPLDQLRDAIESGMRDPSIPIVALRAAALTEPAITQWLFIQQDLAFDTLTSGSRAPEALRQRLRARFHLLSQLTLDVLSPAPTGGAEISQAETIAYVGDLWMSLLAEIAPIGATTSEKVPEE